MTTCLVKERTKRPKEVPNKTSKPVMYWSAACGWRTLKTHPSLLGASKKHWKKLALQ
jgi:hypothetical protein